MSDDTSNTPVETSTSETADHLQNGSVPPQNSNSQPDNTDNVSLTESLPPQSNEGANEPLAPIVSDDAREESKPVTDIPQETSEEKYTKQSTETSQESAAENASSQITNNEHSDKEQEVKIPEVKTNEESPKALPTEPLEEGNGEQESREQESKNDESEEEYDPENIDGSDLEEETQRDDIPEDINDDAEKDKAQNENSEGSDDEYDPTSAFDEDEKPAEAAEPSSEQGKSSDNLMSYVMSLPFINHPKFITLSDGDKKSFIAGYVKNPNDPKFKEYKSTDSASSSVTEKPSKASILTSEKEKEHGLTLEEYKAKNPFCKRPDLSSPMGYEELSEYSEFAKKELEYISEGALEQFPLGSRLFIGNLPANNVTKQNLWRIFKQYGEVIQISIKTNFGFCQFKTAEQCADAIKGESNVPLHGRMMQLEISKSHKNKMSVSQTQLPASAAAASNNSFTSSVTSNANSKLPSIYEYTPLSNKRHNRYNDHKKNNENKNHNKKQKHDNRGGKHERGKLTNYKEGTECQIYVKKAADHSLVGALARKLSNSGIVINVTDVVPQTSLKNLINDAAYSGVNGIIIVHRDGNLDVQVFQQASDGGVKFDEYQAVTVDVAVELFVRAKKFKKSGVPTFSNQNSNSFASDNNNSFTSNNNSFYGNKGYNNKRNFNSFSGSFGSMDEGNGYNNGGNFPNYNNYNNNRNFSPVGNRNNSFQQNSFQSTQMDSQQIPYQQQQQQQPQLNSNVLQTLSSFDPSALQNLLALVQQVQPNVNNQGPNLQTLLMQLQQQQQQPLQFQQPAAPQYQPPPPQYQQAPQFQQMPPQNQQYQQYQQMPSPGQPPQLNNTGNNSNSSTDPNDIQSLMQTLQRLQEN